MRPHVSRRVEQRHTRLHSLGYRNYCGYLQSPHWLCLRQAYKASELPQGCVCGEVEVQLHHMTYERIGCERLTDLTPLCRRCHALVHELEARGEIGLDLDGLCDEGRAQEGRSLLAVLADKQSTFLRERRAAEQQEVLALPFASRLLRVIDYARYRRPMDIRSRVRTLTRAVASGATDRYLTRSLRGIEAHVYGWDDWIDWT